MKLSDIKLNPANPRTIKGERLQKLTDYLAEYGDLSGVVYNSNPECQALISGHQRMQVFKKSGGSPVILEQYSPPQEDGTVARTVDLYSRRLQNQERITQQITERLDKELSPKGVAVVLTAQHLCMAMRGVKKHDTWTTTSKMSGTFRDDLNCRQEFLRLLKPVDNR